MQKVAAIDIGTNSIRYMVMTQSPKGQIKVLDHGGKITRLGEGLHSSGKLKAIAQTRTLKTIQACIKKITPHQVNALTLFATSAVREAKNGKIFAQKIKKATGYRVEILSGSKEAHRAYQGITASLPLKNKKVITLDIGGGSTELVYPINRNKLKKISLKLGAVRLHEMIKQNPEKGLKECTNKIQQMVSKNHLHPKLFIGAGGTLTTLAAIDQKLKVYDHQKIHGYKLKTTTIQKIDQKLKRLSLNQRKKIIGLDPKRADIILTGTTILLTLLNLTKTPQISVSNRGILYGTCLDLLKK